LILIQAEIKDTVAHTAINIISGLVGMIQDKLEGKIVPSLFSLKALLMKTNTISYDYHRKTP